MTEGETRPDATRPGGGGTPAGQAAAASGEAAAANARQATEADAVERAEGVVAAAAASPSDAAAGSPSDAAVASPSDAAAESPSDFMEVKGATSPDAERLPGEGADAAEASGDGASAEGEGQTEAEAPKGPKLVRRVVCSYQLGWLPGDWLQTWRRLDRVFARANLKVKATLAPLEDLPEDTDILVVPPELRDVAREAARPGTPILVTPAGAAAGAFAELVSRLQAGTDFTADTITDEEKAAPKIVSYRGHTLLD
jgi:hypothetical protein